MTGWITLVAILSLSLTILLVVIGFCYQLIREKIDHRRYPPPGQLVDVGGYHLHIHCSGEGGPTVVMDAGLGLNSLEWSLVQPEIAKFTSVCSYDRAGYGWSEASPLERTSENIVQELHTLLQQARVPAPYTLVGHSFGGVNVRLYAATFPDEVAGVVLVDSAHEEQLEKLPMPNWNKRILSFLACCGISRLLPVPRYGATEAAGSNLIPSIFPHELQRTLPLLPEAVQRAYIAKWSKTQFTRTFLEEVEKIGVSFRQMRQSKCSLGAKPLIVITAEKTEPREVWQSFQKELVTNSSQGKQLIAESGHLVARNQPKIVVQAVQEIIQGVASV